MTTTLPISNESMARAILRRTLREAPREQLAATRRAVDHFAPSRHRRGPLFRAKVRFMDECLGNRVLFRSVTGKGKAALAEWVFWEILGEVPRPVICAAALDGRQVRLEESELVRVSQHALKRLFQRLRTEDPSAALGEVLPAAFHAAELSAKARAHQERYQVHLHVPTGGGRGRPRLGRRRLPRQDLAAPRLHERRPLCPVGQRPGRRRPAVRLAAGRGHGHGRAQGADPRSDRQHRAHLPR